MTEDAPQPSVSFDEFKLFYETTEKVTDRRLATNRWNYSVCLAMLVGAAATGRWALLSTTSFIPGSIAAILICSMAILFCRHWLSQIEDFKSLNNAKFNILNQMAPLIVFDSNNDDEIKSFQPFVKEWDELKKSKAVVQTRVLKLEALTSSNIEYFIPKAFIFLFSAGTVGIIIVAIFAALMGFSAIFELNSTSETVG